MQTALQTIAYHNLAPVSIGLSLLYGLLGIAHLLILKGSVAYTMSAAAWLTAATLAALPFSLKRGWPPVRYTYWVAAAIALAAAVNSLLHLRLTNALEETTNVMLTVVGAALLILSTRWFLAVSGVVLIGWLIVSWPEFGTPAWSHFAFGLLIAALLATLVHLAQVNTIRRLESLRLQSATQLQERQRLEEQLRLTATAMESAANMMVITDPQGIVTWVNPAFTRQTGYNSIDAVGQELSALRSGVQDPVFYKGIWDTLRMGHVWQGEITNRRKDGSLYVEENVFTPVYDGNGRIAHFIAIAQDVTARKQAEEEIMKYSEHLEDKVDERTRELREAQARLLRQQRLEQEVKLAAEVQNNLLPRQAPAIDGYEFAATASPARYISGDLYDFIQVGSDTCHIVLADIAGKGIPAALLTSTARTLLRAEVEHSQSPSTVLARLNRALYKDLSHAEKFITLLAARLDARQGSVTYANAGHTEAIWYQTCLGTLNTLAATGLPIGIEDSLDIREDTVLLRPGDLLIFYSDGVTEAMNPQHELFGTDRLNAILVESGNRSAAEVTQAIVQAVSTFAAGAEQADDFTLIVLKSLPRQIDFQYPAQLDQLDAILAELRQACLAYGETLAYQLELIASELLTNIIKHAYHGAEGDVRGRLRLEAERISLDIYDDGLVFGFDSLPPPDLAQPHEGGYGLFIVRQLADELTYTPMTSAGNHWHIVKLTPAGGS